MENTIKVLDHVQEEIDKARHEISTLEAKCIRQPRQTIYLLNNVRAIIDGFEKKVLQIIIREPYGK